MFNVLLMFCVMAALLLKKFMRNHGTDIVPPLLISMVYVGGLLFSEIRRSTGLAKPTSNLRESKPPAKPMACSVPTQVTSCKSQNLLV